MAGEVRLQAMRRRDLKHVMEIERAAFPEPWNLNVFTSELALRSGRAYRTARAGRELAGYYGLMFVDNEAHVTTIAVSPSYQGQGVGTFLLLDAVEISLAREVQHLSLEVAASNERAQRLYRRFGFAPVGVRKGYYPVTGEDAFIMWVRDIDGADYAERLASIRAQLPSGR